QVFFRNLTGVVFVDGSLIKQLGRHQVERPLLLISRHVIGTQGRYVLLYSVNLLGKDSMVSYLYTYSLCWSLCTFLLYIERPSKREIAAIWIGIIGVWLIFRPDMEMPFSDHLLGLGNALLTTFAYLAIKELSHFYDSRYIVLSFMLSGILLPILSLIAGHFW